MVSAARSRAAAPGAGLYVLPFGDTRAEHRFARPPFAHVVLCADLHRERGNDPVEPVRACTSWLARAAP